VGLAAQAAPAPASPAVEAAAVLLTNAAQIRQLTLDQAEAHQSVKLRGVVTAINPGSSIFLQDDTGGTFIRTIHKRFPAVVPGTWLEAEGTTFSGRFVPGIDFNRCLVLGRRKLPEPVVATFDDLVSARWHYQRVQVAGIVRAVTPVPERKRTILTVALGGRKLQVNLLWPGATNAPVTVAAQVRITGLAAGLINDRRQLIAPELLVSRRQDLVVEQSAPADPFSMGLTPVRDLLQFSPAGVSGQRVHVRGVVTYQRTGKAVFLREAKCGLEVQTTQTTLVEPGDVVEAVGFPAMGTFSAHLEDAEFRVVAKEASPEPVPITLKEALLGANDGNLVSLSAHLVEMLQGPAESVLVLEAEDTLFHARLPRSALAVRNGSVVRLRGICRVQEFAFAPNTFSAEPRAMELLLRSPADIAVESAPAWWTTRRLGIAVGVLLAVSLVTLGWIALLRRRVADQAAVICAKVQREAALEERHRLAREMHDTLAQSFSGLAFQLDAVAGRLPAEADQARSALDTARQIARHGQEGFRRSLMNLRAQELERGSLTEALPEIARQITAGTGIELRCQMSAATGRLPEAVETNLLRIGQECIANAVRHARPTTIELALEPFAGAVRLRISDDGVGFDPRQLDADGNGHFGWCSIRERAEQIGATVNLESSRDHGTAVTVTFPC
jgi:signal transduction histidine kinase